MKRLILPVLIVAASAGCGVRSGNPVPGTARATGTQSEIPAVPEPVPFETIVSSPEFAQTSMPAGEGHQPGGIRELTPLHLKFCWCPAGRFMMGSPDDAPGHLNNEAAFEATISKGFWIQQMELTQSQYERLMGPNPAYFKGGENPVESVMWTEASEFCRRLSELPSEKAVGNVYRLPTEAEWEYACRAGSTTEFSFGDDELGLDEHGWYGSNSERKTHPVGQKRPNSWGLHDMHGNVSEWCLDFYGDYPRRPTADPRGPETGEKRNLRGGGWFFAPMFARSAHRDGYTPSARYAGLGFRIVAISASGASSHPTGNGDDNK